jgi:imidazolonepropionase-like amidohydrolase
MQLGSLFRTAIAAALLLAAAGQARAQDPAPPRGAGEGDGPHQRLVIRGVTVIDGTGAPPYGPADIVIEGNRIAEVQTVGYPLVPVNPQRRPQNATREIDGSGMYVMPGFIDLHTHAGGPPKNPGADYAYKLWLAHGITTVRGVGLGPMEWSLSERERSARNEIVAPRIVAFTNPGAGSDWRGGPINTPESAREWVRYAARKGIDGLKLTAHEPAVMTALIDEARRHGLGTTAHLAQLGVARMNALDAARIGLHSMEHFYGLFEALLKDRSVQDFPVAYNYQDEQHRFGQVARLWNQIHAPGSERWRAVIDEMIELGFIIDPTMTIYEASRDVMRARNADWHEAYTLPSMWDFYQPSREAHGSYWFDWTTHDEVAWRNYYKRWMEFLNDYKNAGGRVTTGSDSGFIYKLYGFGYIEELELLQEAGFHPLEVIRAATLHGAEAVHEPKGTAIEFGVIRPGMLADLVLVEHNPLANLKVLYGTGHFRLNDETAQPERVGGVRYTIKDGIIYDARALLADVRRMVDEQKRQRTVSGGQ